MDAAWAASYGLDFHANGSGYVPVPGDLIVLHSYGSSPSSSDAGHVSVVSDPVDAGSGVIHAVEENYSSSGRARLRPFFNGRHHPSR